MRKYIFFIFSIIHFIKINAQCDCQKITDANNQENTQCSPRPIAADNTTQVALSVASNGESDFVQIVVRFKGKAKKISSTLSIILADNKTVVLKLLNTQLAYIGNSEVSNAIYTITNEQKEKLKLSDVKTISFKLSDALLRTYTAKTNTSVIKEQLNCL
jgi:hypothetical protein